MAPIKPSSNFQPLARTADEVYDFSGFFFACGAPAGA
jgi:hypothetical protein